MSTRFIPTLVRSAITVVETEHERTTTERDAFTKFADRLSDLDVSTVDLHLDRAPQAPVQILIVPETPAHNNSPLARVRDAYRDTVMNVPHYEEDDSDSLPESFTEEFGPEIAAAVTTNDQLTPLLRDRLIETTHDARQRESTRPPTGSRKRTHRS